MKITGTVQGIGFRPFVYRMAQRCSVKGYVSNTTGSVLIHVEGSEADIVKFKNLLIKEVPSGADIVDFQMNAVEPVGFSDFCIEKSSETGVTLISIPFDLATCDECNRELFDPEDKRYRYPFINCTQCGPRFTIVDKLPYDRENTSMKRFPFCDDCRREYENPMDRRYHAEPNACPACGPSLTLLDAKGEIIESVDPVNAAISGIVEGKIVAIKGLGGYHLAADATSPEAVDRLRRRKVRDEKPFAVMVPDMEEAEKIARLTMKEKAMLLSKESPILIVDERNGSPLAENIAPGLERAGIFVPYTPLHKLILSKAGRPVVMTSGNLSDEPIVSGNGEAEERLGGIADLFLIHDRDVVQRTDDSVVTTLLGKTYPIRRARGYVPSPVVLNEKFPTVAGLGGDLKNTFCIVKENCAFLSQHLGDMIHWPAREHYRTTFSFFLDFLGADLNAVCRDLHPGYFTTGIAGDLGEARIVPLQHHRAHIYSLMAESGFSGKGVGVAFDGTGYGDDGAIWGGEFFILDGLDLERRATFEYFSLQGGDSAVKAPWKSALSLLYHTYGYKKAIALAETLLDRIERESLETVLEAIVKDINTVPSSSCGRLFDAVSAITGVCLEASYEGQPAMFLEGRIEKGGRKAPYYWEVKEDGGVCKIDQTGIIRGVVTDMAGKKSAGAIAKRFHDTLSDIIVSVSRDLSKEAGGKSVLLSGGVFQNLYLMKKLVLSLRKCGLEAIFHRRVPPNDGGISLGQAFYAANITGGK
ncbi:MAG: carbamoyltransferase HypF [Deltaproteobacteria bacterium]|nr:carbamoyltransferase HypF [Deltaproteobacteria bacterium]